MRYIPGDLVRAKKTGNILVIVTAEVFGVGEWYEFPKKKKDSDWHYTVNPVQGKTKKHAFWTCDEINLIKRGPAFERIYND